MLGRRINPDEFVNDLVDKAGTHVPGSRGRFSLHGHSAGAQFAARYLVSHPGRLEEVVLSAPSTYPFPDPGTPWPNGMATAAWWRPRRRAGERVPRLGGLSAVTPRPAGWLAAASEVSVTVLAGSRDTEPRPAAPGQQGSTRLERAIAWVESMGRYAEAGHRAPAIRFVLAEGLDHDEAAMADPAQEMLARRWGTASSRGGQ